MSICIDKTFRKKVKLEWMSEKTLQVVIENDRFDCFAIIWYEKYKAIGKGNYYGEVYS